MVSSVTYMTGMPLSVANFTAFADCCTIQSKSHSSADRRVEVRCRRGADEEVGLDGDAGALGDVDDRTDVILVRAPRGARRDGKLLLDDLAREPLDGALDVRPRAGEPDVGVVDADGVHEVEDADFFLERGIGD